MKQFQNIWMPDEEQELIEWMTNNGQLVDGKGTYQYPKLEATLRNCRSFRRCIEQGSHIGLWTMHLAKRFDYIECFEPVARLRECWLKNVEPGRINLFECALGKEPGRVSMLSNLYASGDSYLSTARDRRNIGGHVAEPTRDGDVEMRTIDSFDFIDVDLIKLDAEGYEENIARGAERTIRQWRPTIVVEQKRDMARKFGLQPLGAVQYLQQAHDYRVAEVLAGDYVMVPV